MAPFPAKIVSQRLGVLALVQYRISDVSVHRHYEPAEPIEFRGGGVLVRKSGLGVALWPPSSGVPDASAFGALVDDLYDRLTSALPEILTAATGCVEDAIGIFWQIDDEPAPKASDLLRLSELVRINFAAGSGDEHVVMLYDTADLIGGHDLLIYLDADLRPTGAHFDG